MLYGSKEQPHVAIVLFGSEYVLPLAASGVYPKTRVWGSEPENVHCSSATAALKIELRRGCEESSGKTAVGSGVSFKYDPFGRRIYKSSSSTTSIYAYDDYNLIEETNASGAVVARYSQTENIDEPLAMLRSSTTSYYEADGLGSVTSLSNGAGALAQTYTLDSFGKLTNSSGSLTNPFQYTAREFDSETGLYFYRARYYDPNVGRFLSEDPLRFDSDSANFYLYVTNRPSSLIDPLGLGPQAPIPPQPILPILMCPFCTQATLGANDMWNNYRRMEQTKWIRGDKYYHCFANCQATNQGPGGALAAKVISFVRTDVISRVREPGDWRNDDVANKCGQQGGDCNERCKQFIPKYSPGKPTFKW